VLPTRRSVHLLARRIASRAGSPFVLLTLAGVGSVAVIGVLLAEQVRRAGIEDAERDAEQQSRLAGVAVVAPALTQGVLEGDPGAIARLDRLVRRRVLVDPVSRIKIWDASGRIVYSDERRLIGQRFKLEFHEASVLGTGAVHSHVADFGEPDNRYERGGPDLLEVYLPIRGPDGRPLVYESYQRFASITTVGRRFWAHVLPSLLGGLLLLQLANIGLATWFGARLRRGDRQRAALLRRTLRTSDAERRRIAADLHDGVVQDLTGVAFAVDGAARRLEGVAEPATLEALTHGAETTRRSVRELRSLLGEVYPPDLATHGLEVALQQLASGVERRGLQPTVQVDEDFDVSPTAEALLFRAAQEGLRNAAAHASARRVVIHAGSDRDSAWLEVRDDGDGFEPRADPSSGHFGLRALADLLEAAGGRLDVRSVRGKGSLLRAEVPTT
jgi:two-component system NarL family sensor kinase